jgi:pyruvate formate-lyase activating enzyme-like uncharacterized protein
MGKVERRDARMKRAKIIRAIKINKDRAVKLGFDWPSVAIEETETATLESFLKELEEFFKNY